MACPRIQAYLLGELRVSLWADIEQTTIRVKSGDGWAHWKRLANLHRMYTGGIPGESRRRVRVRPTCADHRRFGLDRRPGSWSAWKARADGQQEHALHGKHLL